MKVVVTGGAGFIGANLVRALLAVDAASHVTVVDDLSTGRRDNLDGVEGVDLRIGSILDERLLDDALRGAEAVVHLAALASVPRSLEDPLATHTANATGTLHVLKAIRRAGGPYTVVASSSSIYGDTPTSPKSEDLAPRPLSPYAASKLATEAYAQAYASAYGIPLLTFRFFNVFGPLQPADHAYAAVVPAFVSAALAGRPLTVHGDGYQTRDFTYVASVIEVILESLRSRVTSDGPVNLAFGSRRTLLGVITILERVLGRPLEVVHAPPRPGDVRHSQADQSRLRALFPDIVPVDFERGLKETVAWFAALQRQASEGTA